MKLLGISGTIVGAKPAILVNEVLNKVREKDLKIDTELLDLKNYNMEFSDGREVQQYNDDTQKIIRKVMDADFYLIGTPVFNGSIPAPLKNLFDLLPPATLRHKIMGFVAVGGTYQHYLMIENQLKPIAGYLRAYTTPSYVYAHNSHFNEKNEITDDDLQTRINNLAEELILMQQNLFKKGGRKQGLVNEKMKRLLVETCI
ncbi:NADPH-dependent FMN reductase [Siminovitchia fortis]|uniref:NADPH-dependent FMN reductase n=1 Tax=Siminovitchia fortis TaxID=254758 RepID=UPI0011A94270|nr:NAD(P)H-dependent oxidoreductase [Siminovitchia fortis]